MTILIDLILIGAVLGGVFACLDEWQWRRDFGRRMEQRLRKVVRK